MTFTGTLADLNSALEGLTYAPTLNFNGAATLAIAVDDQGNTGTGPAGTDSDAVTINFAAADDAPTVDLNGPDAGIDFSNGFTEAAGGVAIADTDTVVTEVDASTVVSATLTLTNRPDGAAESLSAPSGVPATITVGAYAPGTGVLVLTANGSPTLADWETAIEAVRYDNTSNDPDTTSRTVQVTVNDGALDSAVATSTIAITPVNTGAVLDLDADDSTTPPGPSFDYAGTFVENGAAVPIADADTSLTDDESFSESATITLTSAPDAGEAISLNGTFGAITVNQSGSSISIVAHAPLQDYIDAIEAIRYSNPADNPTTTPRSVTVVVFDGLASSNTATATITVQPSNDAPTLDLDEDDSSAATGTAYTGAFIEDAGPVAVSSGPAITDADSALLTSATLTLSNPQDGLAESLTVPVPASLPAGISVDGASTPHQLILTGSAAPADYEAAIDLVRYGNTSQNPTPAPSRVINATVSDGVASSAVAVATITVSAVNDAPAVDLDADDSSGATGSDFAVTFTEHTSLAAGSGPVAVSDADTTVVDPDNATLATATITLTNHPDGAAESLSASGLPATITAGAYNAMTGVLVLTGNGAATAADFENAIEAVRYANTSDTPSADPRLVSVVVSDGTDDSATATATITVVPVNDPPTADDETFDGDNRGVGNTTFVGNDPTDGAPAVTEPHRVVSGDLLDGDNDPDGPSAISIVPVTDGPTAGGGTVTIEADGDFAFVPPAGCGTSHSFDYNVTDGALTDTATVTVEFVGCAWYVQNNAAAGGAGTSKAPFDTLLEGETSSLAGHTVFVFDGDDTTADLDTGFAMDANGRLIGQSSGFTIDPDGGGTIPLLTLLAANPAAQPTLTTNTAEDVVVLAAATTVDGFAIEPFTGGGGISGGTGTGGPAASAVTIANVNIHDNAPLGADPGLELHTVTGSSTVSNLTVNTTDTIGVRLNAAGTVSFASAGTISITTSGDAALDVLSTNLGTSVFDTVTVTGSMTGGVSLVNVTNPVGGSTTFGDGTGTDLDLETTGGTVPAFGLSSAGTVSVPSAAAALVDVQATGGPAIDISGTTPGTGGFTFDDVDSTNSASDGINLDGLGTGNFTAASGTIAGATGISFDLSGGSGTVTYPGALEDGSGQAIEITGRTGGTVTLSGLIGDDNDMGGGIRLDSNTSGTTVISNASKTINTTTNNPGNPAVNIGVDMTASAGHTLRLTGGGLNIDTAAGRGVNVSAASVGAGVLEVSGSGNTIDTGAGIALNVVNTTIATEDLTFEHISSSGAVNGIVLNTTGSAGGLTVTGTGIAGSGGVINASGDDGITVTSSAQLSLAWMNITNNGNAANDEGINLVNVSGTLTLTNLTVTGSAYNNLRLDNTTGTISNLTISGGLLQQQLAHAGQPRRTVGVPWHVRADHRDRDRHDLQRQPRHGHPGGDRRHRDGFGLHDQREHDHEQRAGDRLLEGADLQPDLQHPQQHDLHRAEQPRHQPLHRGRRGHDRRLQRTHQRQHDRQRGRGLLGVRDRQLHPREHQRRRRRDGAARRQHAAAVPQRPRHRGHRPQRHRWPGHHDHQQRRQPAGALGGGPAGGHLRAVQLRDGLQHRPHRRPRQHRARRHGASTDLLPTYIALVETSAAASPRGLTQLVDTAPANANCTDQLTIHQHRQRQRQRRVRADRRPDLDTAMSNVTASRRSRG